LFLANISEVSIPEINIVKGNGEYITRSSKGLKHHCVYLRMLLMSLASEVPSCLTCNVANRATRQSVFPRQGEKDPKSNHIWERVQDPSYDWTLCCNIVHMPGPGQTNHVLSPMSHVTNIRCILHEARKDLHWALCNCNNHNDSNKSCRTLSKMSFHLEEFGSNYD